MYNINNMESPRLKRNSIGLNNSTKVNQFKCNEFYLFSNYNNNNNKANIRPTSKSCTCSNTNYDENTRKSNSTFKTKSHDFLKQRATTISKKNKSTKKSESNFDYSRFDSQNIEYNLQKNLSRPTIYGDKPFLSRMEMDIKNRQSKEGKRRALLEELKPKVKEEKRIKCFNRLINDSNRRNKIKENIENQNEFFSSGISPQKMSKKKWDIIYDNRFYKYQEKIDNSLREKIIENEKMIIKKEEDIVEQINSKTKKVTDDIKKEDTINNNDKSNLTRGQKQHGTVQSTKIREKKNSYFGTVIIKTSTFEQRKTHSLIKFMQNIKCDKNMEKRPTLQPEQREIKEIENENLNLSILNKSNNQKNIKAKKKNHVNFENIDSMSDIWAQDVKIKKSQSLKRILVNDINSYNLKFNINYKKNNKKIDNGINIINADYYKNIDEDDNKNPDIKINDLNMNDFAINDLKNNMNGGKKIIKNKHFNSPTKTNILKNNKKISNNSINSNSINNIKQIFSDKKRTKNKNNNNKNSKYIDELTAMKMVENIFVNKIKDKI